MLLLWERKAQPSDDKVGLVSVLMYSEPPSEVKECDTAVRRRVHQKVEINDTAVHVKYHLYDCM